MAIFFWLCMILDSVMTIPTVYCSHVYMCSFHYGSYIYLPDQSLVHGPCHERRLGQHRRERSVERGAGTVSAGVWLVDLPKNGRDVG